MALAFSVVDRCDGGKRIEVMGAAAASGNYPTGGETLELSQPPLIACILAPFSSTPWIEGLAGYDHDFIPGAITGRHKSSATYRGLFHSPNPIMLVGSGAGIPPCGPANAARTQQGSGPSQNPPSPRLQVPQDSMARRSPAADL